jgi:uncharacterized membrane protein YfcA
VTPTLITLLVFAAAFIQALAGFGFAAMIMPVLTWALGLPTAAPLVAIVALTVYAINLLRYRQAIDVREVLRLAAASVVGVPLGIWALVHVDESLIKTLLGLSLAGYAVYALLRPTARRRCAHGWVYPAGFLAGCLGGAYNTPGPPVIVYGSLRQWPKDEFRAVLQALFLVNGTLVVASHAVAGHLTAEVLSLYLWAAPALLLGIGLAARLDSRVDRERFRTLVTVMILLLGLSLVFG